MLEKIKHVCSGVELVNPHKIAEYCQKYPEVLDFLPEAIRLAREAFPDTDLYLYRYDDSEIDYQSLVVYVDKANPTEDDIEKVFDVNIEIAEKMVGTEAEILLDFAFYEGR